MSEIADVIAVSLGGLAWVDWRRIAAIRSGDSIPSGNKTVVLTDV
jgi:hypothetical protein